MRQKVIVAKANKLGYLQSVEVFLKHKS